MERLESTQGGSAWYGGKDSLAMTSTRNLEGFKEKPEVKAWKRRSEILILSTAEHTLPGKHSTGRWRSPSEAGFVSASSEFSDTCRKFCVTMFD